LASFRELGIRIAIDTPTSSFRSRGAMRKLTIATALMIAFATAVHAADDGLRTRPLRVLYVGNRDTDRGRSYARFLGETFTLVAAMDRRTFDPRSAKNVDVVVLDWSQGDIQRNFSSNASTSERDLKSPLGERSQWDKPTVLLGSAGHLMAAPWKVFGGSG
jgi:hypothetical protein